MKILVIGYANSIFIKDYIQNVIQKHNYDFTVFSLTESPEPFGAFYKDNGIELITSKMLRRIYSDMPQCIYNFSKALLISRLKKSGPFDAAHVHFVTPWALEVADLAQRCNPNMKKVVSFHGSDIFRVSERYKTNIKKHLANCNKITVLTAAMKEQLLLQYDNISADDVSVIRFGNPNLNSIIKIQNEVSKSEAKQKLGVAADKIVVTCGYKSGDPLRHLETLEQLNLLDDKIKSRIYIIIPLTYGGSDEYNLNVSKALSSTRIDGHVITQHMDDVQISYLRIATDIFINVQTTDAISASMIEHLYCGTVVINGSWLDYRELEHGGVFYLKIDRLDKISFEMINVIENIKKYQLMAANNPQRIKDLCSWESQSELWSSIY